MTTSTFAAEAPPPTSGPPVDTGDVVDGEEYTTVSSAETATMPADAHSPVSSNLGLGAAPSASAIGNAPGGSSETGGAETSLFEEDTDWTDARAETDALGADEESAVDAGLVEADQDEFFQFLAPALPALINVVAPAAAKALTGTGVPPSVLQGLGSLFGSRPRPARPRVLRSGPQLRQESSTDTEAVDLDEAAIAAAVEQLEVIIGTDDRVRITNTREVPWKRIVQLSITASNGRTFLGTGFLVGSRTIITAGHCVYMHTQGGYVRQIMCSPGRNGSDKPYSTLNASRVWTVRGWTVHRHRDYDYAAVVLPRPFPASDIGAFGFGNFADLELMSSRLNLAGYPGDKPLGTIWYHGRVARQVTPTRLFYDIDSVGGQSGSPVWLRRPDGKRYVVGIHTTGSLSGNSAVRINREVFRNLRNWRNNPDG